jgi:hypothetical protein
LALSSSGPEFIRHLRSPTGTLQVKAAQDGRTGKNKAAQDGRANNGKEAAGRIQPSCATDREGERFSGAGAFGIVRSTKAATGRNKAGAAFYIHASASRPNRVPPMRLDRLGEG